MQIHKTALLLSLGYAAADRGEKDIVDLRDRDALEAAQYAVDNLPTDLYNFQKTKLDSRARVIAPNHHCDYLTAEILDGESEVVAGMKYDLDIEVVDCDHYCVGIFEAEIYVDPSWNIQVTEWGSEKSCDEVDSFDGDGDSFDGIDYEDDDNDAFDSFDGDGDSFDGFDYDDDDNDAFDSFDSDVDSFDGYDYYDDDTDDIDSFDSDDSDDFPNMNSKVLKDPLVVGDDLTATVAPTDNLDGNVPPVAGDDLTATAAAADNLDGTVRRLNSPNNDSDDSDDDDKEWDSYGSYDDDEDLDSDDSDDDGYYYGDRR